jgi:hypothetical protein
MGGQRGRRAELYLWRQHVGDRPESTLKKKSVAICYHFVRESVAMGESLTSHIRSELNPADICTKGIAGGAKRDMRTDQILYLRRIFLSLHEISEESEV